MSAGNVVTLGGCDAPSACGEPREHLVSLLRDALAMAESGKLQSFIGTGFVATGERLAVWADGHENVYEMLGSLAWLQHEYAHRHTEALD